MVGRGRGGSRPARRELGAGWAESAQGVVAGLREWRALHPRATLAASETELDRRLEVLRAQRLADRALARAAAPCAAAERPVGGACGGRLVKAGRHPRTVRTLGDQPVRLERQYAEGPAGGSRVFPPG
ncbi:MAG TPA: hypothetical protein VFW96_05285 [Thermomicrobiales bacterium]|nr:hypothetical protein [Thermomicrobiales bacterium]